MGKEERASHLPVDKLVQRSVNAPLVSVGVRGILFSRYNNRFKVRFITYIQALTEQAVMSARGNEPY